MKINPIKLAVFVIIFALPGWSVQGQPKAKKAPLRLLVTVNASFSPKEFMAGHRIDRLEPLHKEWVRRKNLSGKTAADMNADVRARYPRRAARFTGVPPVIDLSRTYVVTPAAGTETELQQAAAALKRDSAVESVQAENVYSAQLTPNDPYYATTGSWGQSYADLYGLKQISSSNAWNVNRGAGIVVAVIDTGVDFLHPDMAASAWTHGDGSHGYDFVNFDNDPNDDNGHGSHVAGTVASVGNNNLGVLGLAWQSQVMGLKGLDAGGSGVTSSLAEAIVWATDNGAEVINMSWGYIGATDSAIETALQYAHGQGVVLVAAAGNFAIDAVLFYPASSPYVITVSAYDWNDDVASFSNFGSKIDVAAPGVEILSLQGVGTQLGTVVSPGYMRLSGTSMAAPHVAGLAALILSQQVSQPPPGYSNEQVRQVIRLSADPVDGPGFNKNSGYGRINAFRALQAHEDPLDVIITSPKVGTSLSAPMTVVGTAQGPSFASYQLQIGVGASPSTWAVIAQGSAPINQAPLGTIQPDSFPSGPFTVRLVGTTASGTSYTFQVALENNLVQITSPPVPPYPNQALWVRPGTSLPLVGTADGSTFQSYVMDWAPGILPQSGWSTAGITLAGGGTSRVVQGSLGTWNTTGLTQSGYYTLRLRVQNATFVSQVTTLVLIEPDLAPNWPQALTGNRADVHVFAVKNTAGAWQLSFASPQMLQSFSVSGQLLASTPLTGHIVRPAVGNVDGQNGDEVVLPDQTNRLRVVYPNGSSTLLNTGNTNRWFQYNAVELIDLDADGKLEILAVALDRVNFSLAYLYAFRADGTLVSAQFPITIDNQSEYALLNPRFVAFDADGTGRPQLWVIAKPSATGSVVRKYDAQGVFLGTPISMPTKFISTIAAADLYRDGRKQLILIANDFSTNQSSLGVYAPDGVPQPGWPLNFNDKLGSLAIGDLAGDGQLHLVTSSVFSGQLLAYRVNGQLTPGWPVTLPDTNILQIGISDLNGDGKGDVFFTGQTLKQNPLPASGSYMETQWSAYQGNGTFMKTWALPGRPNFPPAGEVSFAVGDFFGDGKTHIAVSYATTFDNGAGSLLWQDGYAAIFSFPGIYQTSRAAWRYPYSDAQNSGISQSPALPPGIGLKYFDGTRTIELATEPEGVVTSPLRIRKGNKTYGIYLVAPSDPNASKMVIQTKDGKKSLKKL